jgi:hypothetical protein
MDPFKSSIPQHSDIIDSSTPLHLWIDYKTLVVVLSKLKSSTDVILLSGACPEHLMNWSHNKLLFIGSSLSGSLVSLVGLLACNTTSAAATEG